MNTRRFDGIGLGEYGPDAPADAVDHRAEAVANALRRVRDRAAHAGIPVDDSLLPLLNEELGEAYDDGRWQGVLEQDESPGDSEE